MPTERPKRAPLIVSRKCWARSPALRGRAFLRFSLHQFTNINFTLPLGIGLYTSLPSRAAGGSDAVAAGEGDALKLDIV